MLGSREVVGKERHISSPPPSLSPQASSALRIQDSDHTFHEEVLTCSIRLPKIHLHCRHVFASDTSLCFPFKGWADDFLKLFFVHSKECHASKTNQCMDSHILCMKQFYFRYLIKLYKMHATDGYSHY